MNMEHDKDLYYVAVKIFFGDGKGNLLILKDKFGDWDIPGGRLRENDFKTPMDGIAKRKVTEELGDINYKLGEPILFMRHERDEVMPDGKRSKRRIFAVGYKAAYLNGDIVLGKNHEKYEWVNIAKLKPEEYFNGGWLEGVKEYQKKLIKK
jgi:hypothetical protein